MAIKSGPAKAVPAVPAAPPLTFEPTNSLSSVFNFNNPLPNVIVVKVKMTIIISGFTVFRVSIRRLGLSSSPEAQGLLNASKHHAMVKL